MEEGETVENTLQREIQEETGYIIKKIESLVIRVLEYRKPKEAAYDYFLMISDYYVCKIENEQIEEQNLDVYEKELGFTPQWISLSDALQINENLITSGKSKNIPWIERETQILRLITEKEHCLHISNMV